MEQGDNLPRVGRPPADIDVNVLRQLARLGCSQAEIAAYFRVDRSTINRRFATEYELARSECKIFIRRNQMKRAAEGSDSMLIHLGKHMLGQRDKPKSESAGADAGRADPRKIDISFVDPPERSDSDPTPEQDA